MYGGTQEHLEDLDIEPNTILSVRTLLVSGRATCKAMCILRTIAYDKSLSVRSGIELYNLNICVFNCNEIK